MKKLLAMLLAVTTVFSSATMTAFADDLTKENPSTEIDSTLETAGSNPWIDANWNDWNTILCVNVKWSDTTFTYTFGDEWDAEHHKYVHSDNHTKEDGWNRDFITIDVENLSNCPVKVQIADVETLNNDVKITYEKNKKSKNLTSALRSNNIAKENNKFQFIMYFDYTPKAYSENYNNLIKFKVQLSESTEEDVCEHVFIPSDQLYEDNESYICYYHECMYCGMLEPHHYDYDMFGRIYCTGCGTHNHEKCYDFDGNYICDLCGLERDFCEDCHVGGRCVCT